MTKTAQVPGHRPVGRLLLAAGVVIVLTAVVYLLTQLITPDVNANLFGQSATETFALKSWLASGVLALAAFQAYSALWLYGRLPWRKPAWLALAHRLSGYTAIIVSLPVAYHCLFAYGFRDYDRRTLIHSLAGCFFYGAFAAKVLVVRSRKLPGWALPVAGGTMLMLVVVLWYSAALWYFNGFDSPGLGSGVSTSAYPSTLRGGSAGSPARPLTDHRLSLCGLHSTFPKTSRSGVCTVVRASSFVTNGTK